MEHRLDSITMKKGDYKICKGCGVINWYENEMCWNCEDKRFNTTKQGVLKWVKAEYEFWKKEGKREAEIDAILKQI